ncbi:hypothetical protein ZMTM_00910 [Methyloradius palustris]|uniref:Uncharacterized protein n=1 Tax=Methyloradius palustris TaxID=2778876 RepID=A0A8D5JXJ9_9PROT|nr:hypothetical protein ZMTM_00910 [Methyloradius palustris]
MVWLDASFATSPKELLQAFVLKTFNHSFSVRYSYTHAIRSYDNTYTHATQVIRANSLYYS